VTIAKTKTISARVDKRCVFAAVVVATFYGLPAARAQNVTCSPPSNQRQLETFASDDPNLVGGLRFLNFAETEQSQEKIIERVGGYHGSKLGFKILDSGIETDQSITQSTEWDSIPGSNQLLAVGSRIPVIGGGFQIFEQALGVWNPFVGNSNHSFSKSETKYKLTLPKGQCHNQAEVLYSNSAVAEFNRIGNINERQDYLYKLTALSSFWSQNSCDVTCWNQIKSTLKAGDSYTPVFTEWADGLASQMTITNGNYLSPNFNDNYPDAESHICPSAFAPAEVNRIGGKSYTISKAIPRLSMQVENEASIQASAASDNGLSVLGVQTFSGISTSTGTSVAFDSIKFTFNPGPAVVANPATEPLTKNRWWKQPDDGELQQEPKIRGQAYPWVFQDNASANGLPVAYDLRRWFVCPKNKLTTDSLVCGKNLSIRLFCPRSLVEDEFNKINTATDPTTLKPGTCAQSGPWMAPSDRKAKTSLDFALSVTLTGYLNGLRSQVASAVGAAERFTGVLYARNIMQGNKKNPSPQDFFSDGSSQKLRARMVVAAAITEAANLARMRLFCANSTPQQQLNMVGFYSHTGFWFGPKGSATAPFRQNGNGVAEYAKPFAFHSPFSNIDFTLAATVLGGEPNDQNVVAICKSELNQKVWAPALPTLSDLKILGFPSGSDARSSTAGEIASATRFGIAQFYDFLSWFAKKGLDSAEFRDLLEADEDDCGRIFLGVDTKSDDRSGARTKQCVLRAILRVAIDSQIGVVTKQPEAPAQGLTSNQNSDYQNLWLENTPKSPSFIVSLMKESLPRAGINFADYNHETGARKGGRFSWKTNQPFYPYHTKGGLQLRRTFPYDDGIPNFGAQNAAIISTVFGSSLLIMSVVPETYKATGLAGIDAWIRDSRMERPIAERILVQKAGPMTGHGCANWLGYRHASGDELRDLLASGGISRPDGATNNWVVTSDAWSRCRGFLCTAEHGYQNSATHYPLQMVRVDEAWRSVVANTGRHSTRWVPEIEGGEGYSYWNTDNQGIPIEVCIAPSPQEQRAWWNQRDADSYWLATGRDVDFN